LTAPVIIIVVVIVIIPVTHPLVVLTVSHVSPFIPALKSYAVAVVVSSDPGAKLRAPNHDAVQIHVVKVASHRVQQRRVPQPPANRRRSDQIIQPAKASPESGPGPA
jgi:hypothetical protein